MAASSSTPRPALPRIITFTVRVYQWLLGACPPDFRREYGREMAQVFRQSCQDAYRQRGRRGVLRLWLPTLIDFLAGVIAEYGRTLTLAYARRNTVNRLRSTERTIFWAFIGFVLGYLGFLAVSQVWLPFDSYGQGFSPIYVCALKSAQNECSIYQLVASSNQWVIAQKAAGEFSSPFFAICSLVTLLAALVAGLPIGYAALRQAIAARQIKAILLLAVPVLAVVVVVGYTLLLISVLAPGPINIFDVLALPFAGLLYGFHDTLTLLSWLWIGLLALGVIASGAAISRAISRAQISERFFRFAFTPAVVATVGMALVLGSTINSSLSAPAPAASTSATSVNLFAYRYWYVSPFAPNSGATTFVTLWWLVAIDLMAFPAGIAAFSTMRFFLRRARPTVQPAPTS